MWKQTCTSLALGLTREVTVRDPWRAGCGKRPRLVEVCRQRRVAEVRERARQVLRRRARREVRDIVLREERRLDDLAPLHRLRLGVVELAEEIDLVRVEREPPALADVALVHSDQPDGATAVAALLAQLLLSRRARLLADLGPAARKRPEAVVEAAHQQHSAVAERRRA